MIIQGSIDEEYALHHAEQDGEAGSDHEQNNTVGEMEDDEEEEEVSYGEEDEEGMEDADDEAQVDKDTDQVHVARQSPQGTVKDTIIMETLSEA